MQYLPILKQSAIISWKRKILWIFGFFALFLGGGSSEYEVVFQGFDRAFRGNIDFFRNLVIYEGTGIFDARWRNLNNLIVKDPVAFAAMLLVGAIFLAIVALLIWLSVSSQAALIAAVEQIKSQKFVSAENSFSKGRKSFWPVFGLNIIAKFIIAVLLFIIGMPFLPFLPLTPAATDVLFVVSMAILIPVAVIVSFLLKYAIAFVVLKSHKLRDGIINGWRLFARYWLISLEMAVILLGIHIAAALAFLVLMIFIAVPFIVIGMTFYYLAFSFGFWAVVVLFGALLVVLSVLFLSWLTTFQYAGWTLLFLTLTASQPRESRLASWISAGARVFRRRKQS